MNNTSDKRLAQELVNTLAAKGLRYVIASPGSRNAPLVIGFNRHPKVEVLSIPDERSAGFFALGMAQYLNEPIALICTSGTAGLNYAPCVAEAFYQGISLIAITADRPVEYTHQEEGQTIDQKNIFANYVKAFFQFPQEDHHQDNLWYANRLANEAYNQSVHPNLGPVHINIPLREPLYGTENSSLGARTIDIVISSQGLYPETSTQLKNELNQFKKILVLCGQIRPKEELAYLVKIASLRSDVVVLSESISNFTGEKVIPCIDRTLLSIHSKNLEDYAPDLLITFDGPVISKKIKAFLRKSKVREHWHIGPHRTDLDTFHALTKAIVCSRTYFVKEVLNESDAKESTYSEIWQEKYLNSKDKHQKFLSSAPYSDLKIFESIIAHLPDDVHLQLGNSSVVRYVQLFDNYPDIPQYGNRGASGIDGCTSTASGYAYASDATTLLITGDVSFFYDTNGLWHHHVSPKMRIILINNGGGNIFKIIAGPDTIKEKEDFFVTNPVGIAQNICEAYGLEYYKSESIDSLQSFLGSSFFQKSDKPKLLEVISDSESHTVLKDYFDHL